MRTRLRILVLLGLLLVVVMKPAASQIEGQPDLERRVAQTVREYGTVESAKSVGIASPLAGEATILHIIPEGTQVKKGDLLVTLDDSKLQETRNEVLVELQSAKAAVAAAKRNITSAKTEAVQSQEIHQLNLKVAELNQKKQTSENGSFAISLRTLKREAELAETRKRLVAMMIAKRKEAKDGPSLEELKFESDKAEAELANVRDQIQVLTTLEHPHQTAVLELAVARAKGELLKQRQQSEESIAKAERELHLAELVEHRVNSKLQGVEDQLAKCRITAPSDGLVLHANTSARRSSAALVVEEGATVRERQSILNVVDLSQLQLRVAVHESRIHRVKRGQSARIRFDALPSQTFTGKVVAVGKTPEPASWISSDVKTYAVTVSLDGPVDKIKLGLSALLEIEAP